VKITIERPDPKYPLVWVYIPVHSSLESEGIYRAIESARITLLGRWEPHNSGGRIESFKAPGLLENEHVKPRKTARKK
jgi:hypothetical protein